MRHIIRTFRRNGVLDNNCDIDRKFENERLRHAGESLKVLGDTYRELDMLRKDAKISRGRDAAVSQLYDMSDVFNEYSGARCEKVTISGKKYTRLTLAMHRRGISADNITLVKKRDKYYEVSLNAKIVKTSCATAKELADIISVCLERRFIPDEASRHVINREFNRYVFIEEAPYRTIHGVARCKKSESDVSGDNFSVCTPDSIRTVMCLSDGMGSGRIANCESEIMIELMERFMEAGFMETTAIKMINLAFATENYNARPLTMDVAVIDRYNGQMKLIKLGAAPTFIKRANTKDVEIVYSSSMPAGVFERADIEETSTSLSDGDMVIMVSDGIIDAIKSDNKEEYLQGMIAAMEVSNPKIFADRLLRGVTLNSDMIKDDMTIITTGIWSRDTKNLILT